MRDVRKAQETILWGLVTTKLRPPRFNLWLVPDEDDDDGRTCVGGIPYSGSMNGIGAEETACVI